MFFDAALIYDPQTRSCDLALSPDGDLIIDTTAITPMLLSVELDRRAANDDPLPQAQTEETKLTMHMWLSQALEWVREEIGQPARIQVDYPKRGVMAWYASVGNADIDPSAISRAVSSSHGLLSNIIRLIALETREIQDHIAWNTRQIFIDTAEDNFVEQHAATWGVKRREATKALGQVSIQGEEGAVIPQNIILTASDKRYITLEAAKLNAQGKASLTIEAEQAGKAGNIEGVVKFTPVAAMPQIQNIQSTEDGIKGGAEAESLEELRQAIISRIRQPPHGGAASDYETWVKQKFPIYAVSVVPQWLGRGSVGVIVSMRPQKQ